MKVKKIDEMNCVNESITNECIHPMTTDLENLEDGEYFGYRYEYMFELENGFKFRCEEFDLELLDKLSKEAGGVITLDILKQCKKRK